ncbi:guanine nucleotide exchange factor [Lipomyces kononenkoae]
MKNSGTAAKSKAANLLDCLISNDSGSQSLSHDELIATLVSLKLEGRDPKRGKVIFNKESLELLLGYGVPPNPLDIRLEALRIIANALLLSPDLRKQFSALQILVRKYKGASTDEEFVVSRIMFLLTIEPEIYKSDILHELHEYIFLYLVRRAEGDLSDYALSALTETCKLLFNVLCKYSNVSPSYDDVIAPLLSTINRLPRIINSVSCSIISCLLRLPCNADIYFRDEAPIEIPEIFFELLSKAVQPQEVDTPGLDDTIAPLLVLLSKIFTAAHHEEVREYFKAKIFPSEDERSRPLGQSSSLASHLLQIVSNPTFMKSREIIYQIMWDGSDHDVSKFIYHIGYGYAVGYIVSHDIPVPEGVLGKNVANFPDKINPVTGELLEKEPNFQSLADMSDEEKEREAERLFVLFERVRENGIINVENPVRTAVESGRFQELPD